MIAALARLRTFSALRHRDYRLFWTGALISLTGTWMQGTAQSYLVWELTRSALATSLVFLFFSLPSTAFSLFGGAIADRVDRRKLLLVTQGVFMAQAATLTVLTFTGWIRVWQIYALALVNGTVMALDSPARQSMIPSLVSREDLTSAVALNSTVFNASRVVGPPLGGLIYAALGPAWCFALNTVSFLAILYPLAIIRPARPAAPANGQRVWQDVTDGLRYVRGHAVVRTLLMLVALVGLFAFTYVVLMPVMASAVLGGGPKENGYLLGAAGVGATLGALAVATLRSRRPGRVIVGFGYAAAALLVALALSRSLALSMLLTAAAAGCLMAFMATSNSTIQSHVEDALRGRVMSLYTLALIGSGPLNSVIAGTLGNTLGAPAAIALSAAAMGAGVALIAARNRHVVEIELEGREAPRPAAVPVGTGR